MRQERPVANIQRVGDLEIDEDLPFQERMWRAQRVGWALFAIIIVAATLGLFGPGPLSSATAEQGPLRVEYNRFERFEAPATLDVHVAPGFTGETVAVWLPHDYLQHVEVASISPEPLEVRDGDNRLTYYFSLQEPGAPAWITFHLTPMRPGLLAAQVGLDEGPAVQFTQFVYP
jgi:hypothetical protein